MTVYGATIGLICFVSSTIMVFALTENVTNRTGVQFVSNLGTMLDNTVFNRYLRLICRRQFISLVVGETPN